MKFEWIRILDDTDSYLEIIYMGHFCLIKNTIWDNEKDFPVSSSMIRINMCDLDSDLHKLLIKGEN